MGPRSNAGIIAAVESGALRSVSLMANTRAFDDAVRFARTAVPEIGVGLHFNLTHARPLTAARTLVNPTTGEFLGRTQLVRAAVAGTIDTRDVELECQAQLDRLRDSGLRPTHIDGHHHVHVLPKVRDAVARCAAAAGVPFVRRPSELTMNTWRPWRRVHTRTAFAWWSRAFEWSNGVRRTDHFRGFTLAGSTEFATGLATILHSLPPGVTELMVHPAHGDAPVEPDIALRMLELSALIEAADRRRTSSNGDRGYRLTHFGELAAS